MTQAPQFSIVVPLYNKAAYAAEAVASVLAQTGPALEVIVVDDGSTDGGAQTLAPLADARLRLVHQSNAGVSVARNRGIDLARGEFVGFLDADDIQLPGHLAALDEARRRYPQDDVFCTGYWRVSGDGQRRAVLLAPGDGRCRAIDRFQRLWSQGSFTNTNAIVVRRSLLKTLQPAFPPGERLGEDQDLWLRLAELRRFIYLAKACCEYREQVSGSATQAAPVLEVLPCFERLGQRLAQGAVPAAQRRGARRLLSSHWLNVARARALAGDRAGAQALLADPRARGNWLYWLRCRLWLSLPGSATRLGRTP